MQSSKIFWRGLFFILLITALCGGMALPAVSLPARAAPQMQATTAAPGDVVISEFRSRGGTANDEFVELYNRTNTTINIGGWTLRKSSGCGTTIATLATIPSNTLLNPGQYYLAAGLSYNGIAPDYRHNADWSIADTGGVAVLDNSASPVVIDQAGMCATTSYVDGSPLTPLSGTSDQSYERNLGGTSGSCQGTNDNSADFLNIAPSDPQNLFSVAVPCIRVTNVTSPIANGTYTTNAPIDITVTFSGVVNVTGSPTLLLETGATDRTATYVTGSGSTTLTFNYMVATGDSSGDLDYVATNSLALNGGTITGATGDAILTLPSPGSAGSLGANKDIVIDNGLPPTVTVEQASGQADPAGKQIRRTQRP
jgi:hypothetical protein